LRVENHDVTLPAEYRFVGDPAALERAGLFVAEGRAVVQRLLEDGRFRVHSIVVAPPAAAALEPVLGRLPDRPRLLLAVGAEGGGLSPQMMRYADTRVRIPIDDRADSLNVVVAAAIVLSALR